MTSLIQSALTSKSEQLRLPVKITREERENPEIKRTEKRESPKKRRRMKHPLLLLTLPSKKSLSKRLPSVREEEEEVARDNSDHMNSRTTTSDGFKRFRNHIVIWIY
jgi:hypothetical protein